MPRLMSVALTEQAVVERRKTVTRRLGWRHAYPGMPLTLCRKVMGRRHPDGTVDPLVRLAEVVVVSARPERLDRIDADDVAREGFPGWTSEQFIAFFAESMRCDRDTYVSRIEWRYLDGGAA
jgi:hypothetical protein